MSLNTPHAEPLVDSTGNSWLDSFIHYGLIFGAIFQLICIFAVVLIPQTDEEKVCLCWCVGCIDLPPTFSIIQYYY